MSKFHRTYTFPKHRLNIPNTIVSESPAPPSGDFYTPQGSGVNGSSFEVFYTPNSKNVSPNKTSSPDEVFQTPEACFDDIFDKNFNQLQKSASSGVVVERFCTTGTNSFPFPKRALHFDGKRHSKHFFDNDAFLSKSERVIPTQSPRSERILSDVISAFLTPHMSRKDIGAQSTPLSDLHQFYRDETRAVSMGDLKWGPGEGSQLVVFGR